MFIDSLIRTIGLTHETGDICMGLTHSASSVLPSFLGSLVALVEALAIVLAVGVTRGWRSAITGAIATLVAVRVIKHRTTSSLPASGVLLGILYCAGVKANAQQLNAPESVIRKSEARGVSGTIEDPPITAPRAQEEAAPPDDPSASLQQQSGETNSSEPSITHAKPNTENPLNEGRQTKRILYIMPNFRAVSTDQRLPPQTGKEKFKTAALDSVDYSSLIFVAIQAGVADARNSTPEFRQGAAGYARYYWHTYADYADENLWVEFIFPAALRQDSRYYTLGRGGFPKRLAYSFSRLAITRTDSGHEAFNASEIFGAGAAAGISSLYYPSQERTFTKTYQLWLTNILIDGASSIFKEFWPDINNKFVHQED